MVGGGPVEHNPVEPHLNHQNHEWMITSFKNHAVIRQK